MISPMVSKIAFLACTLLTCFCLSGCLLSKTPINFGASVAPLDAGTYVDDNGHYDALTRSEDSSKEQSLHFTYNFRNQNAQLFHLSGCMYVAQLPPYENKIQYMMVKSCHDDEAILIDVDCSLLRKRGLILDYTDPFACLEDDTKKLETAIRTLAQYFDPLNLEQIKKLDLGFGAINHVQRIGTIADLKELEFLQKSVKKLKNSAVEAKQYSEAARTEEALRDFVRGCEVCDHAADATRLIKAYRQADDSAVKLQTAKDAAPKSLNDNQFFELKICNEDPYPADIAVAAPSDPIIRLLTVRGYWRVKNECKVLGVFPRGRFFIHAHRTGTNGLRSWPSKGARLCTPRGTFARVVSSGICLQDETALLFKTYDADSNSFTWTLHPQQDD